MRLAQWVDMVKATGGVPEGGAARRRDPVLGRDRPEGQPRSEIAQLLHEAAAAPRQELDAALLAAVAHRPVAPSGRGADLGD